ncbi:Peptidoglycan/LPS O-acetylase OafA/YrhL, contains acyltransferase and SGNH-hydrolase domains [Methylobacterium sp. 190mf]|uniref:acyltransferase family protein n=1 Tax=Methylobacterium sp. 190mf TaxID=1761798 RepID=UPI00089F6EAC|nr:acyltransferase [Methylobacterium sp. 190mf]SEG70289.1 Peptidoglycan/LPS O-acetylase OafA/YrhL, contains acyltransferase and SGNH-hydrolase domains [Methylobacterium sp. 190mf]
MIKVGDCPTESNGKICARISELDSLRGVAALSVVIYHFTSIYPRLISGRNLEFVPQIHIGYFGVEIFFMISGFVIFHSVKSAASIHDFFLARFARIFPAYWLSILIVVALSIFTEKSSGFSSKDIFFNLTMLQALMGFHHLDEVYWTLTYELCFYACIVFAFCACRAAKLPIELALLIWLISETIIRANGIQIPYRFSLIFLLNYGQFFIIGIAFFLVYHKCSRPLTYIVLLWAIAMSAFGANPHTPASGFKAYFWIALACTCVFYWAVFLKPAAARFPVLIYLGRISYSLYLIHASIGYFMLREFDRIGIPDFLAVLLAIASAIVIAHFIHILVEVPGQRLLRSSFRRVQSNILAALHSA